MSKDNTITNIKTISWEDFLCSLLDGIFLEISCCLKEAPEYALVAKWP